ncbi:MAG: hypothetical protein FWE25_07390 [Lachnospiraceae bacterium]|nr:hypothetical protein [Lachnospiraceae bacterium]
MKKKESSKCSVEYIKSIIIVILIIVLVCVAVVWPTATSVFRRVEARAVQGNAKNVELSARLLSLEYLGFGTPFVDSGRQSGFSKQAEAEIREKSQVEGNFYLVAWDIQNNVVEQMLYEEGDFAVRIIHQGSGKYTWEVYYLDRILK